MALPRIRSIPGADVRVHLFRVLLYRAAAPSNGGALAGFL